jgi:hypothetical protein
MFAALSKFANDPGGVDERSTIIRQRRAESIIDLVLRPPNCEKIPRHRARSITPLPMWDNQSAVASAVCLRVGRW